MSVRKPADRLKRRLEALNSRADYLIDRVKSVEEKGIDPHYDKAELSAIVFAINLIEDNPELALTAIRGEPSKEELKNG